MKKILLRIYKYYLIYLVSIFARNRRPCNYERQVLIARFDGFGDFCLLIPFIQNLSANGYNIVCISSSAFEPVIKHLQLQVTFLPFNNQTTYEFRKLLKTVNSMNFDYAFNLSMNVWGGILVNQSRAGKKIGLLQEREHYVYKGARLFYDQILSYPPSIHSFDVLQNTFKDTMKTPPAKHFIVSETGNDKYIVLHPYAKWKPRQWPNFHSLIEILNQRGFNIKIIGTPQEHKGNPWISEVTKYNCVSIINLQSIDGLLSQIENTSAFIGNDSGPAHYAALIGKPTTVIWGPGYFERIHPVGENVQICILPSTCRPCRQKNSVCKKGANFCLIEISVEMVLEAFERTLLKAADEVKLVPTFQ